MSASNRRRIGSIGGISGQPAYSSSAHSASSGHRRQSRLSVTDAGPPALPAALASWSSTGTLASATADRAKQVVMSLKAKSYALATSLSPGVALRAYIELPRAGLKLIAEEPKIDAPTLAQIDAIVSSARSPEASTLDLSEQPTLRSVKKSRSVRGSMSAVQSSFGLDVMAEGSLDEEGRGDQAIPATDALFAEPVSEDESEQQPATLTLAQRIKRAKSKVQSRHRRKTSAQPAAAAHERAAELERQKKADQIVELLESKRAFYRQQQKQAVIEHSERSRKRLAALKTASEKSSSGHKQGQTQTAPRPHQAKVEVPEYPIPSEWKLTRWYQIVSRERHGLPPNPFSSDPAIAAAAHLQADKHGRDVGDSQSSHALVSDMDRGDLGSGDSVIAAAQQQQPDPPQNSPGRRRSKRRDQRLYSFTKSATMTLKQMPTLCALTMNIAMSDIAKEFWGEGIQESLKSNAKVRQRTKALSQMVDMAVRHKNQSTRFTERMSPGDNDGGAARLESQRSFHSGQATTTPPPGQAVSPSPTHPSSAAPHSAGSVHLLQTGVPPAPAVSPLGPIQAPMPLPELSALVNASLAGGFTPLERMLNKAASTTQREPSAADDKALIMALQENGPSVGIDDELLGNIQSMIQKEDKYFGEDGRDEIYESDEHAAIDRLTQSIMRRSRRSSLFQSAAIRKAAGALASRAALNDGRPSFVEENANGDEYDPDLLGASSNTAGSLSSSASDDDRLTASFSSSSRSEGRGMRSRMRRASGHGRHQSAQQIHSQAIEVLRRPLPEETTDTLQEVDTAVPGESLTLSINGAPSLLVPLPAHTGGMIRETDVEDDEREALDSLVAESSTAAFRLDDDGHAGAGDSTAEAAIQDPKAEDAASSSSPSQPTADESPVAEPVVDIVQDLVAEATASSEAPVQEVAPASRSGSGGSAGGHDGSPGGMRGRKSRAPRISNRAPRRLVPLRLDELIQADGLPIRPAFRAPHHFWIQPASQVVE
ncbi:hypothetical protein HK105_200786 [Polyrhizophydium stewartii]|uniref:Uncharacterized protein n=1 Tax=Polyrhizophydium stewartii TaxID=2732419 RepID=A0ABR4NK11_9FUNG